jgi:hypothetical protein
MRLLPGYAVSVDVMKRSDIPEAEIFAACDAFHQRQAETPDIALADKYPPKVVLAKMQQLNDQGKLDYGVSPRTAWVVRSESYYGVAARSSLSKHHQAWRRWIVANGRLAQEIERPFVAILEWLTERLPERWR